MTKPTLFVAASVFAVLLASCSDSNPPIMGDDTNDPTTADGNAGSGGKDSSGSGKPGGSGGGSANTGGSVADSGQPDPTAVKCGDVTCSAPAECKAERCVCPDGYDADGTGCADIDECAKKNGGCDTLTACTNTDGARTCGACPVGYSGDGEAGCDDIDECAKDNGGCDTLTTCTNTDGARTCGDCPSGYTGDGVAGCTDINECDTNNGDCDALTTCTNIDGARSCGGCPGGYTGDGLAGCDDINECLTSNGGCDALTTCTNIGGGRTCGSCPSGYTGNGTTSCANIDECVTANDCSTHATCLDSTPGYSCTCNAPAYTGAGGKVCTCASGYSDVGGGVCKADNGTACANDTACVGGNCVNGICCSTKCVSPPTCKVAAAATCSGGTTCVYANASNTTACDDNSACTTLDECLNGTCTGKNPLDCSDSNLCTTDSCDPSSGCAWAPAINCDNLTDACKVGVCNTNTGACAAIAVDCGDGDLCTTDSCDSVSGCAWVPAINCDNLTDACNFGLCDANTGTCGAIQADDNTPCRDNACKVGQTCQSGICSPGSAVDCNDGDPCTNDPCDTLLGCSHPPNAAACNDSDLCTTVDVCAGGTCQGGSPKDCVGTSDSCNVGTCDSGDGVCKKVPRGDGTPCTDSSSCTTASSCSSGQCGGTGDVCGGVGVGVCTPIGDGSTHSCACAVGFKLAAGPTCVAATDECAGDAGCPATACKANADCNDPTATCGNILCTCKPGYVVGGTGTGAGRTCTDINECLGNPCGAGTCTENAPGAGYTCACGGLKSVDGTNDGVNNPTCVCDLGGTFAFRIQSDVSWPAAYVQGTSVKTIDASPAGAPVTTYSWAIRQHTYDSTGKLQVSTTQCGGTAPELCGPGFTYLVTVPREAYGLFYSNQIWGTAGMPVQISPPLSIPNALPGAAFKTPDEALLLGMSLTEPLGAWPASRQNVLGGTAARTNGAVWVNNDSAVDIYNQPGVTIYSVPPAGISIDGLDPDPPVNYPTSTSLVCPRGGGAKSPRAYTPALEGLTVKRVKRFYAGSRVISGMDGAITTCDLIQGDVTGPNPDSLNDPGTLGEYKAETRFYDCVYDSDADCPDSVTNFFDTQPQNQKVEDASFIIKRVSAGITCDQVRALAFP